MKYEAHAHCKIYQPKYFAGILTPLLLKKGVLNFLDGMIPFTDKDILSRLADFARFFDKTESQVFQEMFAEYPDTIICVKIMDLSCMGAGKVQKSIVEQTLQILSLNFTNIRLFPVIDPRSEHANRMYELMKSLPTRFSGFGIYPNIGYTADDYRLERFWKWANDNNKAVIIHCTDTTPVYYRGSDLDKLLEPIKNLFFYEHHKSKKLECGNFCHPYFGIQMARKYTNVNVSFAHAGGSNTHFWQFINRATASFKNVYFDTSSTIKNKEQFNDLYCQVNAPEKMLCGYDWFMSELNIEQDLTNIYIDFMPNIKKFLRE